MIEYIQMYIAVRWTKKYLTEDNLPSALDAIFYHKKTSNSHVKGLLLGLLKHIRREYAFTPRDFRAEKKVIQQNLELGGGQWGDFKPGDIVTVISDYSAFQCINPDYYIEVDNYDAVLGETYKINFLDDIPRDDRYHGYFRVSLKELFDKPRFKLDGINVSPNQIRLATPEEIENTRAHAIFKLYTNHTESVKAYNEKYTTTLAEMEKDYHTRMETIKK